MPRALWKGAISFGLVHIPVELYPAEDRKTFKFSMLDKRDLSPVGYKRYSKKSNKEVEWGDIVKGYEYDKDQYVVLTDEDFRRANVKATQTIDIQAFVPLKEIPLEYFETPYYLAPSGRGGPKVYALLRETLRATGRVAIAQVVIRTRQHLAAIVADDKVMMLNTLRYADELRPASGLDLPAAGLKAAGVTAKEVELAKRLVDDMSGQWKPSQFKDTYHEDLMARVEEKIKQGATKEITEPEKGDKQKRSAQVIDLAALLKQSLGKGAGVGKTAPRKAAASRAKPSLRVVSAAGGTKKTAAKRKRA